MTFSRRKILTTIPGIAGIVALAGCGSKTTMSWSVDNLQSEAQVVDKFVTTVIASLESTGHVTADQKIAINAIEAKVSSIIASMSASSGQTLTIDTGKTWAKSLISEIQQLLAIAEPIAAQYNTQIATYLQLGSGLITIIQTIVGMATASARFGSAPADRNVINAAVYKGIGV